MTDKAFYVILENQVILTKKAYTHWHEIQAEFADYKTSLGPWTMAELLSYFEDDYPTEDLYPFSVQRIKAFYQSETLILME